MQSSSFFEYLCKEISWKRLLLVRANLRKKLDYHAMLMREKRYAEHDGRTQNMHYRIFRDVEKAINYRNPLYNFRMYKRDIPAYFEAAHHWTFSPFMKNLTTSQFWDYWLEHRRAYATTVLRYRAEGGVTEYEWNINSLRSSLARNREHYKWCKANNVHPARLADIAGNIYLDYKTIEIITKAIESSVHDKGLVLC